MSIITDFNLKISVWFPIPRRKMWYSRIGATDMWNFYTECIFCRGKIIERRREYQSKRRGCSCGEIN